MRPQRMAILVLAVLSLAVATDDATELNPIRKVVNLLQAMQKKVIAEGAKEKDLYEKFMCHCKTGGSDLSASIGSAETKIPAVSTSIQESEEKLVQTKADLKQAQTDRSAAKAAMSEATALREKEAATYASQKSDYDTNIAAINKAVAALERGMAGGFLQTSAAEVLRRLALNRQDMSDIDRQELVAFLSGTQSTGYAPASGDITGILKEIGDTMSKNLAEITADEQSAIQTFNDLMKAKHKEVAALTVSIEAKTKQIGALGVQIVQMKEDLSDTDAALVQDRQFLADLEKSCSTKTAEWEQRQKTRADELVALAETIKVLNDDDALELFKKALPGASSSFVQVVSSAERLRNRALDTLRQAHARANPQDRAGIDFLMVALNGKKSLGKGAFDKVLKMIDDMVALLKKEQHDDDDKKEYCGLQLDQADDKKKVIERSLESAENGIATTTEAISTLKEEIKSLEAGIKALDRSVLEATEQRKAENLEYKDLVAADASAKELLNFAKNRLNKFYNPKLYRPPPKRQLSEQDRITENMGLEVPTDAPGGIAGTGIGLTQIAVHITGRGAPSPPPETWGPYAKKSEESSGVIAMIELLIRDLEKEMTEAETEEKNSQADYETMMRESSAKRSSDSKSLSGKIATLAETEGELESLKEDQRASGRELMATSKYIASLHAECDWLLQYHEVRKQARAGEVDSLNQAKAVLSGADFSMVQTHMHGFLARA